MPRNIERIASRIWRRDTTLWTDDKETREQILNRLGWLDLPWNVVGAMTQELESFMQWKDSVVSSGRFDYAIVLGMGGSSLAPLVFSELFAKAPRHLQLLVLDSTSPQTVHEILKLDLGRCLFIVSSKSGTTLETVDLYRFFSQVMAERVANPMEHFVCITEQGSWLHRHGLEKGFARIFINPPDVGGRYSALSYFGLVPAALHGIDILSLLDRTRRYAQTTQSDQPESNSALALAEEMAAAMEAGYLKLLLRCPPHYASVIAWIEQLIAESTGKEGKGILPVACIDRCEGSPSAPSTVVDIDPLDDPLDVGKLFFKWEFATAAVASFLGVNPFDEPNVAEAKANTQAFIAGSQSLSLHPATEGERFRVLAARSRGGKKTHVVDQLEKLGPNGYIALLAYLPIDRHTAAAIEALRVMLDASYPVPCTVGFGPRYLHSTGQLHKGGPALGLFIQLTWEAEVDYAVPEKHYSFSELIQAQADGDFSVLSRKGLPVIRIELKGDRLKAIENLTQELMRGVKTVETRT